MTTDTHTPNPWNHDSYGAIAGSGSAKLASSRIAPLVALARGYWSVEDADGAKALAKQSRAVAGNMALARQLTQIVAPEKEDLLVMPWFSARSVAEDGTAARSSAIQYRPASPVINAEGKEAKYLWFPGQNMVIDVHPSTPAEWFESSQQVLVTEGLLKGDSALTAMLLASGKVTEEQLSNVKNVDGSYMSTDQARSRLEELMLTVPVANRTVMATSASVTTWQGKDADWRRVNLRGKRVIIAFDGDLADNANVWRETSKFWKEVESQKAEPTLLNLFGFEVSTAQISAGMDPKEKVGIDDYFDKLGDWHSLMGLVLTDLPPKPVDEERNAEIGDWRVHPKNDAVVQEFVPANGEFNSGQGYWKTQSHIGGRLRRHIESRRPTSYEIAQGQVSPDERMRLEHSRCEIEISLIDPNQDVDDVPEKYTVYGPASLMSIAPQDWIRHADQLPNEVLAHPNWPPRKGMDWLSAVKANKRGDVLNTVAWNTMGWVPVPDNMPAFIIGKQVLAANADAEAQTQCGVDERLLPGAGKFGVVDAWDHSFLRPENEKDLNEYKAQVRQDIRDVLRVFVENGFWRNRSTAVTVVCAMYRPTIPKHVGTTLYVVGPKGSGKSYTASFILRGWQHTPGTWSESSLPGSASDTFGAHESSVALAPIWIIDDLAPQSDRRRAEQQSSDLENIIRATFNNSAKRRLDGRTMEQRDVANPIAMLAVTAENPPTVPSIQDRTLLLSVPRGSFNDSAEGGNAEHWRQRELIDLCDMEQSPVARLTAAMVRFWHMDDTRFGATWHAKQTSLQRMFIEQQRNAKELLEEKHGITGGEAQRFVGQIASMALTLGIMAELAVWAGIDEEDELLDRLIGEDGYITDLYSLAAAGILRARSTTPGRALLRALGNLMAAGRAHMDNPTKPGAPPFSVRDGQEDVGGVDVAALNRALGWTFDTRQNTWVPSHGSVSVGMFGEIDGKQIALFNPTNAFKAAQREYPELIPHGQTSTQSWASVRTEGFTTQEGSARADSQTVRMKLSAVGQEALSPTRLSGIPVLADELFNSSQDAGIN